MEYKLYNDDCFNVLKNIDDNSIDSIIIDPPYNVLKGHKIETGIDIEKFIKECYRVLKKNSFFIFFGMQPTLTDWIYLSKKQDFKYKNEIIWYKKRSSSPYGKIKRIHENIIIMTKGKVNYNDVKLNYSDVKESLEEFTESSTIKRQLKAAEKILKDKKLLKECLEFDLNPYKFYTEKQNINDEIYGKNRKKLKMNFNRYKALSDGCLPQTFVIYATHNTLKYNKSEYNIKHPTVKPIELMELLIKLTANENDVILDCFMGSGTTGIACKNLGYDFIGVELDKDYFNIAKDRIENNNTIEIRDSEEIAGDTGMIQLDLF